MVQVLSIYHAPMNIQAVLTWNSDTPFCMCFTKWIPYFTSVDARMFQIHSLDCQCLVPLPQFYIGISNNRLTVLTYRMNNVNITINTLITWLTISWVPVGPAVRCWILMYHRPWIWDLLQPLQLLCPSSSSLTTEKVKNERMRGIQAAPAIWHLPKSLGHLSQKE